MPQSTPQSGPAKNSPFNIHLLVSNTDGDDMYKVLSFDVTTRIECDVTEIPYRMNCALVTLKGGFIGLDKTRHFEIHFPYPAAGNIYLIGGSTNPRSPEDASRVTTRVNLQNSRIERVQPLPEATSRSAAVTSPNAIAICGGVSTSSAVISNCQVYSLITATYVNIKQY